MDREKRRQRIATLIERGDPISWFDDLYRDAAGDPDAIPWAELAPKPSLERWLARRPDGGGAPALVVGCGLGDDAEALAAAGWDVTAFDVSPASIAWARQRFSDSRVRYEVADLLQLPARYQNHFELVFESYTVQSLPLAMRDRVLRCLVEPLAAGGQLLLICIGRDDDTAPSGPPWPVSRAELETLSDEGLLLESFEVVAVEDKDHHRFVAEYRRAEDESNRGSPAPYACT